MYLNDLLFNARSDSFVSEHSKPFHSNSISPLDWRDGSYSADVSHHSLFSSFSLSLPFSFSFGSWTGYYDTAKVSTLT